LNVSDWSLAACQTRHDEADAWLKQRGDGLSIVSQRHGEAAHADRGALLARDQTLADAAEMLWVVLANVSGGDWKLQSEEWQDAAARWRDNYFAAVALSTPARGEEAGGS
jgi:hypothetical protein